MNKSRKAVAYCRVSTRRQADEGVSLLEQDRQLRAWCEANGYTLLKMYHEAQSGKDIKRRPEFQKCVTYAKRQRATMVVYDLTRACRSLPDAFELVESLKASQCGFVSLSEGVVDTTTPQGELVYQIFAAMAEFQRKITAQKTRDSLVYLKNSGQKYCKNAPYGYAWEGGDLVECPEEQRVLNLLRIWVLRYDYGRRLCTRLLFVRKIQKRNGTPWDERSIRDLIYDIRRGLEHRDGAKRRPALPPYEPRLKMDQVRRQDPQDYGPPRTPEDEEQWRMYYAKWVWPHNKYGSFQDWMDYVSLVSHPLAHFESEDETPEGMRNRTDEEIERLGQTFKPRTPQGRKRLKTFMSRRGRTKLPAKAPDDFGREPAIQEHPAEIEHEEPVTEQRELTPEDLDLLVETVQGVRTIPAVEEQDDDGLLDEIDEAIDREEGPASLPWL